MNENLYLLYCYYGIKKSDTSTDIIFKASQKSYGNFWRSVRFENKHFFTGNTLLRTRIDKCLSQNLPRLLESDSQDVFDKRHFELSTEIIHLYDDIGGIPYGVVWRCLNQTLINLIVIEKELHTGFWKIEDVRPFFHVPVELYTLQAATSKRKHKFQHTLCLKCAPSKEPTENTYSLDWFHPEKTLKFQYWKYPEYIEYQKALRNTLKESSYKDPVDWWFQAYIEVSFTIFN